MPLYRYVCKNCGHEVVLLRKVSEADNVKCDVCGGKMIRQIGNVGIVFKGGGYYSTDSAKSSTLSKKEKVKAGK